MYLLPAYPSPTSSLAKMRINSHFVSCGGQIAAAPATAASTALRADWPAEAGSSDWPKQPQLFGAFEPLWQSVADAVMALPAKATGKPPRSCAR